MLKWGTLKTKYENQFQTEKDREKQNDRNILKAKPSRDVRMKT